jgi:hypothetical protein
MLLQILERFFDLEKTGDDEHLTRCPFHDDDKPSLSVNTSKENFYCHACQETGRVTKLLSKVLDYPEVIVQDELRELEDLKPLQIDSILQHRLIEHEKLMEYLKNERNWTNETVHDLRLGWDGKRITIPILNIFGDIVNVRQYKPRAEDRQPKVLNTKGYGKARLYGLENLKIDVATVVLVEGEPDYITARSYGIPAVTNTAGAGTFNGHWARWFTGKQVYVVYDNDKAGISGSNKAARALGGHVKELRVVTLPESGQDLTDYFASGKTRDDFLELCKSMPKLEVASSAIEELDDEIYDVHLAEGSHQKYYKKRVRMRVMVSGKTLAPYLIPRTARVHCVLPNVSMCKKCLLPSMGGSTDLSFDHNTEETLQLVETVVDSQHRIYRRMSGVPPQCKVVQIDVIEAQNVEEVKVIPNLDYSVSETEYVIRQLYLVQQTVKPNSAYEVVGRTFPHPKTQQVTYLVDEVKPLEDSVALFTMTKDLMADLKVFQPDEDTGEVK